MDEQQDIIDSAENFCCICKEISSANRPGTSRNSPEKLTEVIRGLPTLKAVATKLKKNDILHYLNSGKKIYVHSSCRKRFTGKNNVPAEAQKICNEQKGIVSSPQLKTRKLEDSSFNWDKNCFICTKRLFNHKTKQSSSVSAVTSYVTQIKIVNAIKNVRDEFSRSLLLRVNSMNDIRSVNAKYHRTCFIKLVKSQDKREKKYDSQTLKDDIAMKKIIDYINDNCDCQFSLTELMDIVVDDPPSIPTVKVRLQQYYGDNLIISSYTGSPTLICLKSKQYDILNKSVDESNSVAEDENVKKIKEVAHLIKSDICKYILRNDHYPASDNMFSDESIIDVIPYSLQVFLNEIIAKNKKIIHSSANLDKKSISIAHAIMSAVRPNSFLSPLQTGLSVMLHRKFGCRKIIDICHALGFCTSFNEAQLYEASALFQDSVVVNNDTFVQFVFANADFNTGTLTGEGTFHNLGGISIITPETGLQPRKPFPRLREIPLEEEITKIGEIKIESYTKPSGDGLKRIIAEISEENLELKSTYTTNLNTLWMFLTYIESNNYLGWNGFMQHLTNGFKFERSKMVLLPFINSNPSDYSTLFTAIRIAINRARSVGMNFCVITFDQPLYMKAQDIVSAVNLSDDITTILRLGAFHILLSFFGCIGNIMAGSGLKEVLSTVYDDKSSDQILAGHNYSRAVRAHSLVQLALSKIIFDDLKDNNKEFADFENCFKDSTIFYTFNYTEMENNETFLKLVNFFEEKLVHIEKKGNTCKLWVTYFRMVSLFKDFIAAERMGNWNLHLKTVELMIPFFHAARNFSYAKASELYLQKMRKLEEELDENEFNKFKDNHSARTSDNFFSKIPADQTIDQILMKSMKVNGEPFREGATPSVVFKWIKATTFTTDVVDGIEKFCEVSFSSSFQHVDASESRINEDSKALNKIIEFFKLHNPFPDVQQIIAISSGIVGDDSIDCYKAFNVGIELRNKIKGLNFKDMKMTVEGAAKSLLHMSSKIKVNNYDIPVDPNLIFQRVCILKKTNVELRHYFGFELAPYPLSLFDNAGMRKITKSSFYDIFDQSQADVNDVNKFYYVIDGDMLLDRIKWPQNQTFLNICNQYIRYLRKNYGNNVNVVFDGYGDDGIKASERNRRSISNASIDYIFDEDMPLIMTKEKYLANNINKNRFINFLYNKLIENNFECCQAENDADSLIVQSALNCSFPFVAVVAEDIDIFVLLMSLSPDEKELFFLKPPKNNDLQKVYSTKTYLTKYPNVKKDHLLFIHAFTGCDTTSKFCRKDKNQFVKIFNEDTSLHEAAATFMTANQNEEDLFKYGIKCILALYGAKKSKDLNELRYKLFVTSISKNKTIQLSSLPPTEDAAEQHIKRVYLQVQLWRNNPLPPEEWGWKRKKFLIPITMTEPPAPSYVMELIFCSCKTGCSAICGCRRSGLHCTPACVICNGNDCENHPPIEDNSDDLIDPSEN